MEPLTPLEVIFRETQIVAHEKMVDNAISVINKRLKELVVPDGTPGHERSVNVEFNHGQGSFTQAALLEIVVRYRKAGWKVSWGFDETIVQIRIGINKYEC